MSWEEAWGGNAGGSAPRLRRTARSVLPTSGTLMLINHRQGRIHGGEDHIVESAHITSRLPYILLSTDALSNTCGSAHAMPQTDSVSASFSVPCCVVQPLSTCCLIFSVPAYFNLPVWLSYSRLMLYRGQFLCRPSGKNTAVLADIQNPILPFVSVA